MRQLVCFWVVLAGCLVSTGVWAQSTTADAAVSPDAVSPDAVSPDAVSPDAPSPDALSPDAVLGPLMRPGRRVDAAEFSHQRALRLYPSPAGVSHYAMAPEDLAVASPDLADVRVVDASDRQLPYVVLVGREPRLVATVLSAAAERPRESAFAIDLPAAPLAITTLQLDIDNRYIERHFRLYGEIGGRSELLSSGTLSWRSDSAATSLPVALSRSARVDRMRLVIDDGDDAPLRLRAAMVTIAAADLFVLAPQGAYRLLLGGIDSAPPHYELQGVRDRVWAAAAGEVRAGPLEASPRYSQRAQASPPEERDQSALLWGAIGLSVLVLGALTLRLARGA